MEKFPPPTGARRGAVKSRYWGLGTEGPDGSGRAGAGLAGTVAAGAAEYDVSATPTFVIGGRTFVGEQSLEALDAAIAPLLRGKR